MPARNTRQRYGTVAMTLHWLIALLLIGNLCSGFYLANIMDDANPLHFTLIQLHKSIGLTVLMLSVLRLLWRLVNPIPPLPAGMSLPLRIAARTSHFLLYVFMIAVPAAGWAWASFNKKVPTRFFGLFDWPKMPFIPADPHLYHSLHVYLAYSTAALLVLHISAALYHHFHGDDVLRRMWFGTKVEGRS
jgi:cytochrome b561